MHSPANGIRHRRLAFTLIELLVVVTIVSVLLGVTAVGFRQSQEADRIRKGARQVQSFLKGAQNRAIYSQRPVGVRLFLDPTDSTAAVGGRTVTTLAYIGMQTDWRSPANSAPVDLERIDWNADLMWAAPDSNDVWLVRGYNNPGWRNLWQRGLINGEQRIRIPSGPTGQWYPFSYLDSEDLNRNGVLDTEDLDNDDFLDPGEDVNGNGLLDTEDLNGNDVLDGEDSNGNGILDAGEDLNSNTVLDGMPGTTSDQFLLLKIPYHDLGNLGNRTAHPGENYEMELAWQVLPEEPCILPQNVVIDLDASKVPAAWRPANTGTGAYSDFMDIVFSPQGTLIGDAAGAGLIHLYVCDREDSLTLKELFVGTLQAAGKSPSGLPPADGLGYFDQQVGANGLNFIPLDEIDAGGWAFADDRYLLRDRRLVSIFGQTGHVSVSEVNVYRDAGTGSADLFDPFDFDDDSNSGEPDWLADDPYRFAETGREAN